MGHGRVEVEEVTVATMDITRFKVGPCGVPTSTLGLTGKAMNDVEQASKDRAICGRIVNPQELANVRSVRH